MSSALQVHKPAQLVAPDPSLPVGPSFEQMMQLATTIHKSGMFGHRNPESVFVSMLKGRELGVPATVALTMIHVINNKPTASGELMLALVERDYGRGAMYIDLARCSDQVGVVMYRDPVSGTYERYEYTIEMARTAGLTTGPNRANWEKYPGNMLRWRAVSNVAKAVFPASIGGMYLPEEMGAEVGVDADGNLQVIDVPSSATPPGPYANSMAGKPWTDAQQGKLFATAKERGWRDDQIYGRAAQINQEVVEAGLSAMDRWEMSQLIDAVSAEAPWVDPRQQRLDLLPHEQHAANVERMTGVRHYWPQGEMADFHASQDEARRESEFDDVEDGSFADVPEQVNDAALQDFAECQELLEAAQTPREVNAAWKRVIELGLNENTSLFAIYNKKLGDTRGR